MLMVITGAGASYDSAQRHPPDSQFETRATRSVRFPDDQYQFLRPPLTDGLFRRHEFEEFQSRFQILGGVIGQLQDRPRGLEAELQILDDLAGRNPHRAKQLTAVRYYMSLVLSIIPHRWLEAIGGQTNHKTLLEQIRDYDDGPVYFVTFNYDLLIEKALGWDPLAFDEYIQHDWKLLKLHGSVDWARPITAPEIDHAHHNPIDTMNLIIEAAPRLQFGEDHKIVPFVSEYPGKLLELPIGKPDRHEDLPLFPAIAIPLPNKLGADCPPLMMKALTEAIPEVDRLLILGWAGKEAHFLRILKDNGFSSKVSGLVVNGGEDGAKAAIEQMKDGGLSVEGLRPLPFGFGEFVKRGELRSLYAA